MDSRELLAGMAAVSVLLTVVASPVRAQQDMTGAGTLKEAQLDTPLQKGNEPFLLDMPSGTYTPTERIDPALRDADRDGYTYGYLMDDGALDGQETEALGQLGVRIFRPQTFHAHSAKIPMASLDALAGLPFVLWVGYAPAALKITPAVAEAMRQTSDRLPVFIGLFEQDHGRAEAGGWGGDLERVGFRVESYDAAIPGYFAAGSASAIREAAAFDFVEGIAAGNGPLILQSSGGKDSLLSLPADLLISAAMPIALLALLAVLIVVLWRKHG